MSKFKFPLSKAHPWHGVHAGDNAPSIDVAAVLSSGKLADDEEPPVHRLAILSYVSTSSSSVALGYWGDNHIGT